MSLRTIGTVGTLATGVFDAFVTANHFDLGLTKDFQQMLQKECQKMMPFFQLFGISSNGQLQTLLGLFNGIGAITTFYEPTRRLGLLVTIAYCVTGLAAQVYIGEKGAELAPSTFILAGCVLFLRLIS